MFDFYKGMISLRKAHPAFRMPNKTAVDQHLHFIGNVPTNVVAFVISNNVNGDSWKQILVSYNGNKTAQDLTVPGQWMIVANNEKAGTDVLETVTDRVRLEPFSLVVAHSE